MRNMQVLFYFLSSKCVARVLASLFFLLILYIFSCIVLDSQIQLFKASTVHDGHAAGATCCVQIFGPFH